MDIVKKNIVSIICGVVALVALVAAFLWPLDGYFAELKTKVDDRVAVEKKITALMTKQRKLPVYDPERPDADALPKFPSHEIIKIGDAAQKAMRKRSEKAYDAALAMNEQGHGVVVQGSLPKPMSDAIAINFRRNLQGALDKLRTEELLAGIPPTEEEVKNREDAIWQEMKKDLIVVGGEVQNLEGVMAKFKAAKDKLPDQMKDEMATKYKTYVDPANVMRVPAWLPVDGRPDPSQMWWSQVAYWVTADVAGAIKELNVNSKSVLDSPVKNLVFLNVPDTFFPANGAGAVPSAVGGENATPAGGGFPDPTIPLPDGAAQSPTRRVSNNLFDVIHFHLILDIEADKVPLFLKTLATDRFISVTRLEMNRVDSQLKQIQGYVYGPKPVVTLDLACEAIFARQWTIKHMPKAIRDTIGIPDGSQPGGGGAAGRAALGN